MRWVHYLPSPPPLKGHWTSPFTLGVLDSNTFVHECFGMADFLDRNQSAWSLLRPGSNVTSRPSSFLLVHSWAFKTNLSVIGCQQPLHHRCIDSHKYRPEEIKCVWRVVHSSVFSPHNHITSAFINMAMPRVYFDITIGGTPAGRIEMEVR